jgi:hypothetical protein
MNSRRGASFFAFIIGLALGALLGVVLAQKYLNKPSATAPTTTTAGPAVVEKKSGDTTVAPRSGESTEDAISRKMREWNLTPDDLKRDLAKAGEVIRTKGSELGSRVAGATSDVRIISVIKAKYTIDDHLSAWNISVGSDDGHVTLSGTVSSPELIGRAIALALDTSGVVDVKSSLRVGQ